MTKLSNLVVTTALIVFLFIAYALWSFNQPPVRLEKLQQLSEGMTPQQVQALLGEPTSKIASQSGSSWAYSKPLGWSIVYVHFDERDRFVESVYDY
jgi:outer membrane protein assembly factor BamE (lipoprotein component of BamABCDE complex)